MASNESVTKRLKIYLLRAPTFEKREDTENPEGLPSQRAERTIAITPTAGNPTLQHQLTFTSNQTAQSLNQYQSANGAAALSNSVHLGNGAGKPPLSTTINLSTSIPAPTPSHSQPPITIKSLLSSANSANSSSTRQSRLSRQSIEHTAGPTRPPQLAQPILPQQQASLQSQALVQALGQNQVQGAYTQNQGTVNLVGSGTLNPSGASYFGRQVIIPTATGPQGNSSKASANSINSGASGNTPESGAIGIDGAEGQTFGIRSRSARRKERALEVAQKGGLGPGTSSPPLPPPPPLQLAGDIPIDIPKESKENTFTHESRPQSHTRTLSKSPSRTRDSITHTVVFSKILGANNRETDLPISQPEELSIPAPLPITSIGQLGDLDEGDASRDLVGSMKQARLTSREQSPSKILTNTVDYKKSQSGNMPLSSHNGLPNGTIYRAKPAGNLPKVEKQPGSFSIAYDPTKRLSQFEAGNSKVDILGKPKERLTIQEVTNGTKSSSNLETFIKQYNTYMTRESEKQSKALQNPTNSPRQSRKPSFGASEEKPRIPGVKYDNSTPIPVAQPIGTARKVVVGIKPDRAGMKFQEPTRFSLSGEQRQIMLAQAYGSSSKILHTTKNPATGRYQYFDRDPSPIRGEKIQPEVSPATSYRRTKTNIDLAIEAIGSHFNQTSTNPLLSTHSINSVIKLDLQGNGLHTPGLVIGRSRVSSSTPQSTHIIKSPGQAAIEGYPAANGLNGSPKSARPLGNTPAATGRPLSILKSSKSIENVNASLEKSATTPNISIANNNTSYQSQEVTLHYAQVQKPGSIARAAIPRKSATIRAVSEERPSFEDHESPLEKLNARLKSSVFKGEEEHIERDRHRTQMRKSSKVLSVSFHNLLGNRTESQPESQNSQDEQKPREESPRRQGHHSTQVPLKADNSKIIIKDHRHGSRTRDERERETEGGERTREQDTTRKEVETERRKRTNQIEYSPSLQDLIINGPELVPPDDLFEEEVPSEDTPEKREHVARWLLSLNNVRPDTPPPGEILVEPTYQQPQGAAAAAVQALEDSYIPSASRSNSVVPQITMGMEPFETWHGHAQQGGKPAQIQLPTEKLEKVDKRDETERKKSGVAKRGHVTESNGQLQVGKEAPIYLLSRV